MREYKPYFSYADKDKKSSKRKKDKGPFEKALELTLLFAVVLTVGVAGYVIMDTYDFNVSAFVSDFFKKESGDVSDFSEEELSGQANFLVAVTANADSELYSLAIVNADLGARLFRVCVLPPQTAVSLNTKEQTLQQVLFSTGLQKLVESVEVLCDIKIDRYVRVTQGNFEKSIDKLGGLRTTIERDLVHNSQKLSIHVQGGNQRLTGAGVLQAMRYPDWEESEMKQYQLQSQLFAAMLDQYINVKNAENGDAIFNMLINMVESDISVADFRDNEEKLSAYAALEEKNKTVWITARGQFADADNGKRLFHLTSQDEFLVFRF